MTGVDLTRIDGWTVSTALKVISEVGTDMTRWPSAKHFASWLGLSPDNRITGGRVISSKTKASANRAAAALRLAANALHRSDSALGAFLRRKKAHLGAPKAITATAHKLARIIYSMLRYGQEYVDAGAEYYETQYRHRALRAAKQRAAQLGYELVPIPGPLASGFPQSAEAAPRVTSLVSGEPRGSHLVHRVQSFPPQTGGGCPIGMVLQGQCSATFRETGGHSHPPKKRPIRTFRVACAEFTGRHQPYIEVAYRVIEVAYRVKVRKRPPASQGATVAGLCQCDSPPAGSHLSY